MQIEELKQIDFTARVKVIKALAHPSRLLIVEALKSHELCVCELRELVQADISTVSKHLTVLKNAGLLNEEKRGLYVYYSLRCKCLTGFLACVDGLIVGAD
jgi:ArsR family transcriptional regulator